MTEGRPTDHANLSLPELHRAVIRGTSGGKIIWQPRILCWLSDKRFAGEPLPEPFEHMTRPEMFRELKCSARIYDFNACFQAVEDPRVVCTQEQLSETDTRVTWETPAGTQFTVVRQMKSSPHCHRPKWPIESPEDLKVATWRAEHTTWKWDQEAYNRILGEWGDLGLPTMFMPRVNVQHLYIDAMGVERATYAIYDWRDEVETYFRAIEESHDRLIEVIKGCPIEVINFGDNVHAGTLSPRLFEEFVLPSYQRRCDKLHAAGKFVHAHWDGDTKGLLPYAKQTGLDGIEAITPQPQGDVTLDEVKEALGDQMFLIDGIPAILFDDTYPVEELETCTHRIIELFAPKLILGISDEISSTGIIDRIRVVGEIVDDYNAELVL